MPRFSLFSFLILSMFLSCQKKVEVVTDLIDASESTEASESPYVSKNIDLPSDFLNVDRCLVLDNGLRMRDLPHTNSAVIEVLTKGTILVNLNDITEKEEIGAYNAPWFKVQSLENPEREGWVYGAFIGPLAQYSPLSDNKNTTSILNGHPGGAMKNSRGRVFPHGMTDDSPLQIPDGDGPLVRFDSYEGKGVLIFKDVRLKSGLSELVITAADPLGNESSVSLDPSDVQYLYEDFYNSRIQSKDTFFVGFEPFKSSKAGVWHFTLTKAILLYDDPQTEPIYTTLDLTLDLSSTMLSVVPEERNPFESSPSDMYHPGDTLTIYGTGLKPNRTYEVGFYYYTAFAGDMGDGESYPQWEIETVTDERGELELVVHLGTDLPMGAYCIRGGLPGNIDLKSTDFRIQDY